MSLEQTRRGVRQPCGDTLRASGNSRMFYNPDLRGRARSRTGNAPRAPLSAGNATPSRGHRPGPAPTLRWDSPPEAERCGGTGTEGSPLSQGPARCPRPPRVPRPGPDPLTHLRPTWPPRRPAQPTPATAAPPPAPAHWLTAPPRALPLADAPAAHPPSGPFKLG